MTIKKMINRLLTLTLMITSLYLPVQATDIDDLVDSMSLKQKITQTFMMDFTSWNNQSVTELNSELAEVIADYDFGGIILFSSNITSIEQTLQLTSDMQKANAKDGGIPLLISTDQEGGSIYRLSYSTTLPGNMALGATNDSQYAYQAATIIGNELQSVGINTALSPVVDINNNANNPIIGLRSFGDDPEDVSKYGIAYKNGLASTNTVNCAKHFPGHGDTSTDSHYGLPIVNRSKKELLEKELLPYTKLIDDGIDMIMSAHILYPEIDNTTIYSNKTHQEESRPATLSKEILTSLLKEEMGFEGVVCTDALNMSGITNYFDEPQAVVEALKAGADLLCMPCSGIYNKEGLKRLDRIIDAVEKAVEDHELPEERLDDACRRILTLKQKRQILNQSNFDLSISNAKEIVGGNKNKLLEQKISNKAVTVIENKKGLLPLEIEENQNILFLYPYENQKDRMLLGWQRAVDSGLIPKSATVQTYQYYRTNYAIMGTLKNALDWADIIIVNSEVSSDNSMLYTTWTSAGPNTIVNYCKQTNKKSIVMSIDKPYDVQLYKNADAIIAVYGNTVNITAGIEVILGVSGASGKLPLDIPVFDNAKGIYTDEIFYPRGYGITYSSLLQPDAPINLKTEQLTSLVNITWDQVDGASNYQLYRNGELVYEGIDCIYQDKDIKECNGYTYYLTCKNEKGTSDPSESIDFFKISAPSVHIYRKLFNEVKVKWKNNHLVDGYEITYTVDNHTETITVMSDYQDSILLDDLNKDSSVTIEVRSFKTYNDSLYYSPTTTLTTTSHTFIWF